MPTIEAGDVAPHDLREIASFLRNLNGANIDVSSQPEVVADLMDIAEIDFNEESYVNAIKEKKESAEQMMEAQEAPVSGQAQEKETK